MTTSTQKKISLAKHTHGWKYTCWKHVLFSEHLWSVSVLTLEGVCAFFPSAVGASPSLETLPKSRTFSRPLTPLRFLQPDGTTVVARPVKIFGNPQHQQHGEQHHQQTHDPHGNVSGGRAVRGRPFNHTGRLQSWVVRISSRPCWKTPTGTETLPKVPAWDPSDTLNPCSVGLSPKSSDNVSPQNAIGSKWGQSCVTTRSSSLPSPSRSLNRGTVSLRFQPR